jgi:hypothetical protein
VSRALSPSATFATTQPARVRHFSTVSQRAEQTSKVLSNRGRKQTTKRNSAYRFFNRSPNSAAITCGGGSNQDAREGNREDDQQVAGLQGAVSITSAARRLMSVHKNHTSKGACMDTSHGFATTARAF